MKLTSITSFVTSLLLTACAVSSAPPESSGEASQAICASGVRPGCGQCAPDPRSPKGGYRTCWTCDGESYQLACYAVQPPPTVSATWKGHASLWAPGHPTQGDYSIPVKFVERNGAWQIEIDSLTIAAGVTVTLQPNQIGTGAVSGQDATLQLPIEAHGIDKTISLSTSATLHTLDGQTITVGPHDPSSGLFQMVGADPSGTFQAFMNGTIDAWPPQ